MHASGNYFLTVVKITRATFRWGPLKSSPAEIEFGAF